MKCSRVALAKLLLASLALFDVCAAFAFTETNNLPRPEWIQAAATESSQPVVFRKHFVASPELLKAILLVAGDGRLDVTLNHAAVATSDSRTNATAADVRSFLKGGENVLEVRGQNPRGAVTFGVVLELSSPRGKVHWIVSDASWTAALAENDSKLALRSLGRTEANPKDDPFDARQAFDAYNSWQLAMGANTATAAESLALLPGYQAELLRSAQPGEDSWIALAFDPQGRVTIAKEKRGMLRCTLGQSAVEKVELINDTLLECRGLLYAHGGLYAVANNSRGLFRLRDTKGSGQFDEVTELLHTAGGAGHGRNHIKLGPDGALYLIHGDDVTLRTNASSKCPPNFFGVDQLIPAAWDEAPSKLAQRLPLGHLLRSSDQGRTWEMFCGGLRNPLDVAFNEDGEAFSYDADNERDIGAPWYQPTRVLHLVSGGDYGWRRTTATFPEFRPDSLPAAVNIGVGSPTGIEFGTRAAFPPRYRKALFICDWSYGRILAVHLTPRGASYTGTSESFVSGRPLNVTDLAFGPDGAMYFITGGRQTQSGLYRVRYVGPLEQGSEKSAAELSEVKRCTELRALRRSLEILHCPPEPPMDSRQVVDYVWPHLSHPDLWIRHAARVALEWQSFETWEQRLHQTRVQPTAEIPPVTAWLAAARVAAPRSRFWDSTGGEQSRHPNFLLAALSALDTPRLAREQRLRVVRAFALTLIRYPAMGEGRFLEARAALERLFTSDDFALDHEVVELLVYLKSLTVLPKTIPLLAKADSSEELLRYLYCLRAVTNGWTLDQRRAYFTALARADKMQGAREYYRALENIRAEATASLSASERMALRSLLETKPAAPASSTPPKFVQDWKVEELLPMVEQATRGRVFENGRAAFATAQCGACHRVGTEGGVLGPDLTGVASRFGRKEILESILFPSRVIDEKFRQTTFFLANGETLTGTVELEDAGKISVRTSLISDAATTLVTRDIRERKLSDVSPMPEGMLSSLTLDQILDLVAYLEAGGNVKHAMFKK